MAGAGAVLECAGIAQRYCVRGGHQIVSAFRERAMTVLLVTHNLGEALSVGTRLVVLAKDAQRPAAGSRIVLDQPLAQGAPVDSPELRELIAHVRRAGFAG